MNGLLGNDFHLKLKLSLALDSTHCKWIAPLFSTLKRYVGIRFALSNQDSICIHYPLINLWCRVKREGFVSYSYKYIRGQCLLCYSIFCDTADATHWHYEL